MPDKNRSVCWHRKFLKDEQILKMHSTPTAFKHVWLRKTFPQFFILKDYCLLLPTIGRNKMDMQVRTKGVNFRLKEWFCFMTMPIPIQSTWLAKNSRKCIGQHWHNLATVLIYLCVIMENLGLWKKYWVVNDSVMTLVMKPSSAIGWSHATLFFYVDEIRMLLILWRKWVLISGENV